MRQEKGVNLKIFIGSAGMDNVYVPRPSFPSRTRTREGARKPGAVAHHLDATIQPAGERMTWRIFAPTFDGARPMDRLPKKIIGGRARSGR
jgi:hypothetical protein